MREKEIKILWGRSGNRCAICKLELTPDGDRETLGEMAHIVAQSTDGPRGGSDITQLERDKYKNLVLLCPTHHSEIDKNFEDWSVERLLKIKAKHESWVSEQLSTGNINIAKIDNNDFLDSRKYVWQEMSREHVAIALSLTPLRIYGDYIDTMNSDVQSSIDNALLQIHSPNRKTVNTYHTRPSEHGLVNERVPELPKRFGHSLHIFRSGHCEFFRELGHDVDRVTKMSQDGNDDIKGAKYLIRYTDFAEIIDAAICWLDNLWNTILPFEYLDFRCTVINSKNTILYARQDSWGEKVFGYPTRSEELSYSDIVTKGYDFTYLSLQVLKWLSSCYGLVLENKYDKFGKFERPTTLR